MLLNACCAYDDPGSLPTTTFYTMTGWDALNFSKKALWGTILSRKLKDSSFALSIKNPVSSKNNFVESEKRLYFALDLCLN